MKRIDLEQLSAVLRKCPERGSAVLRPIGGTDSNEMVVPSFTGRPMEYRTSVLHQGDDWFAQCSCSGFTKLSKHDEPIKPCVHSAYLIREGMPAPPIEVVGPAFTYDTANEAEPVEAPTTGIPADPNQATSEPATPQQPAEQESESFSQPPRSPLDVPGSASHIVPGTEATPAEPVTLKPEIVNAAPGHTNGIMTKSVWPSGLAIINACPASAWGPADEIVVKSTGQPAVVGSCVHEIGQDIVDQGLDNVPDLLPYLVKYDLEKSRDDVFFPSLFLSQAWSGYKGAPGLSQFFPSPICEKKLEHSVTATDPKTGRTVRFRFATKADVLSFSAPTATELPTSAAIIDWKSGYKDKALDPLQQMWSTAFVVAAKFKTIQTVKTSFVWLRDRKIVTVEFTREELRGHMERFVKYKAFWDGRKYEKGPQCTYCPRLATCPGRMQLIASITAGLTGSDSAPLSLITDANGNLRSADVLARAISQGRFLQKVLYSFFDELAVQLYDSGALKVEGEEGKWIGVTERAGKTSVNMAKGWETLRTMFEEEELRTLATCTKSALQKAVYEKSEYGQKKAAMDSLIGQLDEADAVKRARNSRSPGILTDPSKAVQLPKGEVS